MLAKNQGNLEEARQLYGESQEINKRLGNQLFIANTSFNLGLLAETEGDKTKAARLFHEAFLIYEKLGSPEVESARRKLARVESESQ